MKDTYNHLLVKDFFFLRLFFFWGGGGRGRGVGGEGVRGGAESMFYFLQTIKI